jgi:hypothetical protein
VNCDVCPLPDEQLLASRFHHQGARLVDLRFPLFFQGGFHRGPIPNQGQRDSGEEQGLGEGRKGVGRGIPDLEEERRKENMVGVQRRKNKG